MIIEPQRPDSSFPTLTVGELRSTRPQNLGNHIVGFHEDQFNGLSTTELKNALFFHGFYATDEKNGMACINMSETGNQAALKTLGSMEVSFSGGAIGYGFGPDPHMLTLDVIKTHEATEELANAKRHNSGIKENEAHIILEWVTQKTRNALFKTKDSNSPYEIRGACGLGQGLVGHQCEQMGIDVQYHQVANLSDFSTSRHAFNIVTSPVTNDHGHTTDRHYLVDTTFRQFFINDGGTFASGALFKDWGSRLTQTQAGKEMADELLAHGFVELNEENARLYVESQIAILDVTHNEYVPAAWETHSALASLISKSTVENDYDLCELQDLNIETPAALLQAGNNTPLEKKRSFFQRFTNQTT